MTLGDLVVFTLLETFLSKTRYFQAYFCKRLVLQITVVFANFKRISLFIFRRCNRLKMTNPNKNCKSNIFH